ncbi:hypothetical protein EWM64_g1356 [Hericium alpestre]|uniref:Glucose-methanol-choline oxidoreductase C-terminal domain-containing protein n=1 Tax=Hericium alpestre TaxID=135208 RepID=A0A4Z0A8K6_9AGAM|nr:hypothetical protein EWM64_g1356 [Hericium alpestre]
MLKFVRAILQNEPISECFGKKINPGADVQDEEDIKAWIKKAAKTTFYTAGSCSMLLKELDGMVDPKLRVYGTENIRVVDLSVLPLHIASHMQTYVYCTI